MAKRVLTGFRSENPTFTLIGISTQLKDYLLTFLLNQKLGFRLARIDDLSGFSLYFFRDEEQLTDLYLLSNFNQDEWLIPVLKQTGFFLIVEGFLKKKQKEELLGSIRAIPNILLVTELDVKTIKPAENLLTELELHMIRAR